MSRPSPMDAVNKIAADARRAMFQMPMAPVGSNRALYPRITRNRRCEQLSPECRSALGVVKVYPTPDQGPLHLCQNCWDDENRHRRQNLDWASADEPENGQ